MATTSDVHVGSIIRYNNDLCKIEVWVHRTPGKGQASYQAKMRNLKTSKVVENKFRTGESVDVVRVEYKMMQFIYPEDSFIVVMDTETFEQLHIPTILLGDTIKYLKEGMEVKVSFDEEEVILAEAPVFVELDITYTEPGVKGDTATNSLKPATLETGAEVNVPLFINDGEKIKIDTRTNAYVERVK